MPLVKLLVHCERPDLADDACVLNDKLLNVALWNLNSAICFRRGDLPAYDDEATYDLVSVLDAIDVTKPVRPDTTALALGSGIE